MVAGSVKGPPKGRGSAYEEALDRRLKKMLEYANGPKSDPASQKLALVAYRVKLFEEWRAIQKTFEDPNGRQRIPLHRIDQPPQPTPLPHF